MMQFFVVFVLCISTVYSAPVYQYRAIHKTLLDREGISLIALRSFTQNMKEYYLVVDPHTLHTRVILQAYTQEIPQGSINNSRYESALIRYSMPPYVLQGYGLKKAEGEVPGMFLTMDMCPSKKNIDTVFFDKLISMAQKKTSPLPIAIAITGLWIKQHPDDFKWLLQNSMDLDIVWINHSYSHPYNPKDKLENNFLLKSTIDMHYEILETEKLLIEYQQTPSIFFRFPGLVARHDLVASIQALGLITLSSNAWLAKGDRAISGSIILVHGNSNEPEGIREVMSYLAHTTLLPIYNAIT